MNTVYRNLNWSIWTIVIALFCNHANAQIYFQGNLQYSLYSHDEPLDLVDVKPNIAAGIGVMIFANQTSKFEVAGEISSFRRNFYQKYSEADFKYIFRGMEIRLLTNYAISEKWSLEGGAMAATYTPEIRMNEEKLTVGKGFRDADYGLFVGGHYSIAQSFILGSRFNLWFVNMLKFQEVGDYGDLKPMKTDIRANTFEIYVRFQILNQWK